MTTTQSWPAARTIRHFHHLDKWERDRLFLRAPEELSRTADRDLLAVALGATLYMPADHPDLLSRIMRCAEAGVCSMVVDLEDAVDDSQFRAALLNAVAVFDQLADLPAVNAMVFIRVRTPECIREIAGLLGTGFAALSGFVIPKFCAETGARYLAEAAATSASIGRQLYCMPVLESTRLVHRQTREHELCQLNDLLAEHREQVLALRIGATDMCSTFGIRRDRDLTIYDVRVIADVIGDIVNYLGRTDGTGFVITAPVWEYFADHERLFRPLLRTTPFVEHDAVRFRDQLVSRDLDGLLRELSLDRANGLHGKTVIHPSHVAAVHALSVVTHEEYHDALDIAAATEGGVRRSDYRNKMNEARPHRSWAEQVLRRARVFGVTHPGVTFVDTLTTLVDR